MLISQGLAQVLDALDAKLQKRLDARLAAQPAGQTQAVGRGGAGSDEAIALKLDTLMQRVDSIASLLAKVDGSEKRHSDEDLRPESPPPSPPPPPPLSPPSHKSRSHKSKGKSSDDGATGIGDALVLPPNPSGCDSDSVPAPKEYCGKQGKSCFDSWEKDYMERHAAQIKKGLAAIRAPGCFPHGASVSTMGYFRTGSTLMYNIARVWGALGADGSLVGGYTCKNPVELGMGISGSDQERCSMICKDHVFHTDLAKNSHVVLMTRRDPFYSVCSRKLMDVWCNLDQTGRKEKAEWPELNAYKKKCKESPELERPETMKQCKALMKMQADIYFEREVMGKTIAFDMLTEDYENDPHGNVQNIAKAMGICDEAASDSALVAFIVAMGVELKKHPDHDMGITQMHDVHTEEQRQAKCSNLNAWMSEDEDCKAWMDGHALAESNSELQRLRKDPIARKEMIKKKR